MANEKRLDLIDRNELLPNGVFYVSIENPMASLDELLNRIANAPTVDAVEVVHGRWVFGTANHKEYMKCSVCLKSQTPTGVFTYCPNCGAKMDGGNENG